MGGGRPGSACEPGSASGIRRPAQGADYLSSLHGLQAGRAAWARCLGWGAALPRRGPPPDACVVWTTPSSCTRLGGQSAAAAVEEPGSPSTGAAGPCGRRAEPRRGLTEMSPIEKGLPLQVPSVQRTPTGKEKA